MASFTFLLETCSKENRPARKIFSEVFKMMRNFGRNEKRIACFTRKSFIVNR